MVEDEFDQYSKEIGKELRLYGQDLATRGTKGQPFGAIEISMAIIPIVGWFLKTILKVIIEHEVKKRLEKENEAKLADLGARLNKLESVVSQVTRKEILISNANEELRKLYSDILTQFAAMKESEFKFTSDQIEDMVEVLQSVGLTRRRALILSAKIMDASLEFLNNNRGEMENVDS